MAATSVSWKPAQANSGSAQCQETPLFDEQNITATTWGARGWLRSPEALNGFLFIFSPRNSCPHSSREATIQFIAEKSQKTRIPSINWADQKLPIFRPNGCSSEMVWFSLAPKKQIQPYRMAGKTQIHWFDLKGFLFVRFGHEMSWKCRRSGDHAYAPMGRSFPFSGPSFPQLLNSSWAGSFRRLFQVFKRGWSC